MWPSPGTERRPERLQELELEERLRGVGGDVTRCSVVWILKQASLRKLILKIFIPYLATMPYAPFQRNINIKKC